jgi:hypothetical protein
MEREMDDIEVYHATAVFGPRRWMTTVSNEIQFTSREDAEGAVRLAHLLVHKAVEDAIDRAADAVRRIRRDDRR